MIPGSRPFHAARLRRIVALEAGHDAFLRRLRYRTAKGEFRALCLLGDDARAEGMAILSRGRWPGHTQLAHELGAHRGCPRCHSTATKRIALTTFDTEVVCAGCGRKLGAG